MANIFLRDDIEGRACIHNEDFCSVAIISFNRHDMLLNAIESVHKYADMPFEIVVSDDGGFIYNDFNFINSIKDKVSHIAINLGKNMGLAVNANMAIGMTRSKYVVVISDDTEITKPFMRETVSVLKTAPYIGVIYLGTSHDTSPDNFKSLVCSGFLPMKTSSGQEVSLFLQHGASWANAFTKEYWYHVGGYSEDDVYGDMPFINKGWFQGYFSAAIRGGPFVIDIDTIGQKYNRTRSSLNFMANEILCHYPKIFIIKNEDIDRWSGERSIACGRRNHEGRQKVLNDYDCDGWRSYMNNMTEGGVIHWDRFKSPHDRFLFEIKRDVIF
jgi:glycosyltransferase involved in cell wall biosynthesis